MSDSNDDDDDDGVMVSEYFTHVPIDYRESVVFFQTSDTLKSDMTKSIQCLHH